MDNPDWKHRLREAWACDACHRYRLGLCAVVLVALAAWWFGQ